MAKAPIHELEWRERRSRWFVALAVLLSIAVLASTWVALFSFLGVNTAYGVFQGLEEKYRPDTAAMELALPDLSQVSRIYSGDDLLLAELHDGRFSEPARIGDVPKRVVNAILASEDGRFFEHEGVDWRSFGRALFENVIGRSDQGGSTITQQVAKVFVGNEITAERKIREMFVSVELERRYTKRQILEFYLNSVYFGWSAYGIKAAAREYFGKELAGPHPGRGGSRSRCSSATPRSTTCGGDRTTPSRSGTPHSTGWSSWGSSTGVRRARPRRSPSRWWTTSRLSGLPSTSSPR